MMTPDRLPFEFGDHGIQDVTHLDARRLLKLARRVARGELSDEVVVAAREVVMDLAERQQRRRAAAQRERRAGRRAA